MMRYIVRFETQSEPYLPDEGQMYKEVVVEAEDGEDAIDKAFIGYEHDNPEVIDIWEDGEVEAGEEDEDERFDQ
jgi:hypothetical protein